MRIKKLLVVLFGFAFLAHTVCARDYVVTERFLQGKNPLAFDQQVRGLERQFTITYESPEVELEATRLREQAKIMRGFSGPQQAGLLKKLEQAMETIGALKLELGKLGKTISDPAQLVAQLKDGKTKEVFEELKKAFGGDEKKAKALMKKLNITISPSVLEPEILLDDDEEEDELEGREGLKVILAQVGKQDLFDDIIKLYFDTYREFNIDPIDPEDLDDDEDEDDDNGGAPPPPPPPGMGDDDEGSVPPPPPPPGMGDEDEDEDEDDDDEEEEVFEKFKTKFKEGLKKLGLDETTAEKISMLYLVDPEEEEAKKAKEEEERRLQEEKEEEERQRKEEAFWAPIMDLLKKLGIFDVLEQVKQKWQLGKNEEQKKLLDMLRSIPKVGRIKAEKIYTALTSKEIDRGPKPLTPEQSSNLSGQEKVKSNELFVEKLKDVAFINLGPGTFEEQLKKIIDYLDKEVRWNETFKRRYAFDSQFRETPQAKVNQFLQQAGMVPEAADLEDYLNGLFQANVKINIQNKALGNQLNAFLTFAYEDLQKPDSKLFTSFRDSFAACLYAHPEKKELLASVDEHIFTILVNLIVSVRPKPVPVNKTYSDTVARNMFLQLLELEGPFNLSGHKPVETFMDIVFSLRNKKGNFDPLTQDQFERLDKALQDLNVAKDQTFKTVAPQQWETIFNSFQLLKKGAAFRKTIVDQVDQAIAKLQPFRLGKTGFSPIKDQGVLKSLALLPSRMNKKIGVATGEEFFQDIWIEILYELENTFNKLFALKEKNTYEDLKKGSEIFSALQDLKSVFVWDLSDFIEEVLDFYDLFLVSRFTMVMRQINQLRVHKNFSQIGKMFSGGKKKKKKASAPQEGDIIAQLMARQGSASGTPLLEPFLSPSLETDSERQEFSSHFAANNFKATLGNQIFYNAKTFFDPLLMVRTEEAVKNLPLGDSLDRCVDAYREAMLARKNEFDPVGFMQELFKFFEGLEEKLKTGKQINKVINDLEKLFEKLKRRKINLQLLDGIIFDIQNAGDPKTVLQKIDTFLGETYQLPDALQKQLTNLLAVYNAKQGLTRKVVDAIRGVIGWKPKSELKKFKVQTFSAEKLADALQAIAEISQQELNEVFFDPYRTADSVFTWLEQKFFDGKLDTRRMKEEFRRSIKSAFYKSIEPYGVLIRGLEALAQKKSKKDFETLIKMLKALDEASWNSDLTSLVAWQENGKQKNFAEYKNLVQGETVRAKGRALYKDKLTNMLDAVQKNDAAAFKKELFEFVEKAGAGVEDTDVFKKIQEGIPNLMFEVALQEIRNPIQLLNTGKEFVISGLELKAKAQTAQAIDKTTLHGMVYPLLKGELTWLLELMKDQETLKKADFSVANLRKAFLDSFEEAIEKKIKAIIVDVPLKLDLEKEKARVIEEVEDFVQRVLVDLIDLQKKMKASAFPE